jgi:hypothetical protein
MEQIHRERLEKLATHLETGRLSHDMFNFTVYHYESWCRTSGCALGECPAIFSEWMLVGDTPVLRQSVPFHYAYDHCKMSAMEFFGLSPSEEGSLFRIVPGIAPWNTVPLAANADQYQVAHGIRNFIDYKAAQESPQPAVVEEPEAELICA